MLCYIITLNIFTDLKLFGLTLILFGTYRRVKRSLPLQPWKYIFDQIYNNIYLELKLVG